MTTSRIASTDRRTPRGIAPTLTMVVGIGLAGTAIFAGTALLPAAAVAQTSATTPAEGEEFKLAVVTGNDVYVRSGGADSYYPFGKVNRGDVVKVIGEKHNWARVLTTGPAFREFFAYLRFPNTDEGRFQLDETGRKGRTLGRVRALAPNLNTNYEPDDSWKRILLIEAESDVEVLETTRTERAVVHKIAMPANAEGWISTAFLKPATQAEVAAWNAAIDQSTRLAAAAPALETAANAVRLGAADPTYDTADARRTVDAATTATDSEPAPEPTMHAPFKEITNNASGIVDDRMTEATSALEKVADATADTTAGRVADAVRTTPASVQKQPPLPQVTPPAVAEKPRETPREIPREVPPVVVKHELVEWPVKASPPLPTPEVKYEVASIEPAPAPDFGARPTVDAPTKTPRNAPVRAMPKPVAPPSPFDRIADSIRDKPAKDALADLEGAYHRLRSEPIETAEVLPLRHLYRSLASASTDDRDVARYADARAEQLSIWADLQQRRSELDQLRTRLRLTAKEAAAAQLSLEQSGTYAAVGRLAISTVYDGVRLPRLYRVQDSVTGRTIVYLKPDASFDLPGMIGQVIGVIGRPVFEEKLRLNLVEPKRIDLLAQAQSG